MTPDMPHELTINGVRYIRQLEPEDAALFLSVCNQIKASPEDVKGNSQKRHISAQRSQVAAILAHHHGWTYQRIARAINKTVAGAHSIVVRAAQKEAAE